MWTPEALERGWWLGSDHASASDGGQLRRWEARGELGAAFSAVGGGLGARVQGGEVLLEGDGGLRSEADLPLSPEHTLFGLVSFAQASRPAVLLSGAGPADPAGVVRLTLSDGALHYEHLGPGGPAGGVCVRLGPVAPGYAFFVVRRRGALVQASWNGVLDVRASVAGPPGRSTGPLWIGRPTPGSPGAEAVAGMSGQIRDLGAFDRAITDAEADQLLDWLSARMRPFSLSWGAAPPSGPYPEAPQARHAVVITPNGASPQEHDLASHRYHHHSRICVDGDRIWVAFSSGAVNEDSTGQMVAAASSTDGGQSWTPPVRAIPPQSPW